MKTMNYLAAAAFLLAIGFSSCNKDATQENPEIAEPAFETEANNLSEELEKSADDVTFNKSGGTSQLPDCAIISVEYPDGPPFPKVITVDYGEINCQIRPHLWKRGKVIITLTDSIVNINAKRMVSFEDFFINDYPVSGTRVLTNLGANGDDQLVFDINNDFNVGEWHRQTTGTKTWVEGFASMDYTDNVFLLDGSSSTSRPSGVTINRTITVPLLVNRSCGYIVEGIVSIQWNGNSAIIDFGNGNCDDTATITHNGEVYVIDLDRYRWRRIN